MKFFTSIIFFVVLSAGFHKHVLAQLYFPEDMIKVTGQLVDASSGEALPNVQVLNFRIRGGTMTDSNGKFSLQADPSDTLTFKILGYRERKIPVSELTGSATEYPKILMTVISFPMDERRWHRKNMNANLDQRTLIR